MNQPIPSRLFPIALGIMISFLNPGCKKSSDDPGMLISMLAARNYRLPTKY